MLFLNKFDHRIVYVIIAVVLMVLFEAVQQYYYVLEFSIIPADSVSFTELLKGQLFRWTIWVLFAVVFWKYFNSKSLDFFDIARWKNFTGILVLSTILTILTISILSVEWLQAEKPFESFATFLIFYVFQKGAIFMMAFTGLLLMAYMFKKQEAMEVNLQELSSLKDSHQELYVQLKAKSHNDESSIIPIKTGSKTSFLLIADIKFIEADDYCVRIHDIADRTYTLRSSMKELEQKLEHYGFLRVHRKYIVNASMVTALKAGANATIILEEDIELSIAQNRLTEVKKLLSANLAIA